MGGFTFPHPFKIRVFLSLIPVEPLNFYHKEYLMMAIDPVCKMEVEVETAEWTSEYNGETYYFCAPGCKRSFDKEPQKYLSGEGGEGHHGHHH
jgi:YHS domain-containing protein